MAEQLPDHGQRLLVAHGMAGEGMPQIVQPQAIEPGPLPDVVPMFSDACQRLAGPRVAEEPGDIAPSGQPARRPEQ